jgi:hypothetical protein
MLQTSRFAGKRALSPATLNLSPPHPSHDLTKTQENKITWQRPLPASKFSTKHERKKKGRPGHLHPLNNGNKTPGI